MARARESRRRYARASARGRRGSDNARTPVLARVLHTKRRFLRCFVGRRDCSRAREWRDTRGTRNVAEGAETSRKNRRTNPQLYPLQGRFRNLVKHVKWNRIVRGVSAHAGAARKRKIAALGERCVGTAEQKQAPRDARRGYRRRRPAFSLVRSDRRRLGCSNLGRGRRDRFGGALPGRLRGRTKPRFFLFWHRVRHHGGPEARVHRGQGTWFSHARRRV